MSVIHCTKRQHRTGKVENEVMEGSRSRLDELLEEIPACYIKEVLVRLAPRFLAGINAVSLPSPTLTTLSDHISTKQYQKCTFTTTVNSSRIAPLQPDFFLTLTFPSSTSQPSRLLVPAHSIVYSLASPLIPLLRPEDFDFTPSQASQASQASQPQTISLNLPVLGPFSLPSYTSFLLLHSYLHSRSSFQLYTALTLSKSVQSHPPSPPPSPTPDTQLAAFETSTNRPEIIRLVKRIDDLRQTVQTLGISDEVLWETLERAGETLKMR